MPPNLGGTGAKESSAARLRELKGFVESSGNLFWGGPRNLLGTGVSIAWRLLEGKNIKEKLSDEEVVKRVLAGESELYAVLFQRYRQRLQRIARAIVLDTSEARDIVQHTNVQAYAHLRQFAGRASFSTWLARIAIHEALLRRRRQQRLGRLGQVDSPKERARAFVAPPLTPEEQLARTELRQVLEDAIDGLPERQRMVYTLREVEGMSTAETAECLRTSTRNLKVLLHRARASLRKKLIERLGDQGPDLFRFHAPRCSRVVHKVAVVVGNSGLGLTPPRASLHVAPV